MATITGIGYAVGDYTSDHIRIDDKIVDACKIVSLAGAEVLNERTETAFATPASTSGSEFSTRWNAKNHETREEYERANGRCPRIYKFTIAVEAEELSEELAQAFWASKRER